MKKYRPALEQLETRDCPSTVSMLFRSIDGFGNNLHNPTLGQAGTNLLRVSPAAFSDGISAPSLAANPTPRVLSNALNNQADPANPGQDLETADAKNNSAFIYAFGQFVDHDLDLTPTDPSQTDVIPADPNETAPALGPQTFQKSVIDPNIGVTTPAQQINANTSFLDLSQVYGSSQAVSDALRTFGGGKLKTSPGGFLPYNNLTYFTADQLSAINMANDAHVVTNDKLFAAGDVRANETPELTALQSLFVRNHNRIADQVKREHRYWSDEKIFQEARKLNIASYQKIVYNGYLPNLLGANNLPKYKGYNPHVDPSIATEFSTVAFRFGHSLLSSDIERLNNRGQPVAGGSLDLAATFFDPNVITNTGAVDPVTGMASTGIGPILKGAASNVAQKEDLLAISAIRNTLFAAGGATDNGLDLISRDIQRARDHGIGSYDQVRAAYGLAPVTTFAQINPDPAVQAKLQAAYGTVDNIDPFEGGLAEKAAKGSDLGPLFTKIIADQFDRLRDGDRFYVGNLHLDYFEQSIVNRGDTLAKVISANTGIHNLQRDVFVFVEPKV